MKITGWVSQNVLSCSPTIRNLEAIFENVDRGGRDSRMRSNNGGTAMMLLLLLVVKFFKQDQPNCTCRTAFERHKIQEEIDE